MAGRTCAGQYARRTAKRPNRRRHYRRRRRCDSVPAQHPHPLLLHIVYGRLGLYGPRGIHHGQGNAPHWRPWQVVHSSCHGLRLQCARHPCLEKHREQIKPHNHRADKSFHVVLGPTAYLRTALRHILCRICRARNGRALLRRYTCRRGHGPTAAPLPL